MLVATGFWVYVGVPLPALDGLAFFGLVLREAGIGVVLGCLLCWPFWVLHAMGNLIDNQRGAMLSSTVDPANGVDTSELANFLQLFAAVVYLEGGGMLLMLETVGHSYRICTPVNGCEMHLTAILSLLDALVSKTLVISAPVVATLLVSEALLGLLSRYAPQMNAFSVSLTVKSLVALVVLMLYFGVHLPDEVLRLGAKSQGLEHYLGREGRPLMSSSASKTEKPTAKRLRDASRKGQTFKAKDLVITCLTLCGITYMVFNSSLFEVMEVYRRIIANDFDMDLQAYSAMLVLVGLKALLPLLLVCVLTSALPALLQSGFALASEALKLNLGALNPINGFKNCSACAPSKTP